MQSKSSALHCLCGQHISQPVEMEWATEPHLYLTREGTELKASGLSDWVGQLPEGAVPVVLHLDPPAPTVNTDSIERTCLVEVVCTWVCENLQGDYNFHKTGS